jgi:selenocysteine lyase/cysteine desulfurase
MLVILKRIGLDLIQKEEQDLVRLALTSMSNIPDLTIHGIKNPDSREFLSKGGVISFHLPKILSDKIAKELALRRGICVRYGCHCAHILVKYVLNVSPSLEKFQKLMLSLIPAINLPGTVRVSFGIGNTKEDVVIFIEVLNKIIQVRRMQGDKFLSSNDYPKQNLSTRAIKKQMKDFTETVSQKVYS